MTVKSVIKVILGMDYEKAEMDWEMYHFRTFMEFAKGMSGLMSILCIPFLFVVFEETIAPFMVLTLVYALCNIINRMLRW
ncbi:hypothetical protein P4639_22115 [Priestia megaterium]|uniref:hypothetical protein n=1 Tax=Priestia megaterium TaxID=1404 RepID=UPI002E1EB7A0|nr:hypothetical protein [Priestia megaterium]